MNYKQISKDFTELLNKYSKEDLEQWKLQDLENKIKQFLDSDEETICIDMFPIDKIEDVLKKLGFPKDSLDYDTNGWQIDFWYTYYNSNNEAIRLSGSLHYGDFKLTKVTED